MKISSQFKHLVRNSVQSPTVSRSLCSSEGRILHYCLFLREITGLRKFTTFSFISILSCLHRTLLDSSYTRHIIISATIRHKLNSSSVLTTKGRMFYQYHLPEKSLKIPTQYRHQICCFELFPLHCLLFWILNTSHFKHGFPNAPLLHMNPCVNCSGRGNVNLLGRVLLKGETECPAEEALSADSLKIQE